MTTNIDHLVSKYRRKKGDKKLYFIFSYQWWYYVMFSYLRVVFRLVCRKEMQPKLQTQQQQHNTNHTNGQYVMLLKSL